MMLIINRQSYYMQGMLDSAISCLLYVPANFEEGVDGRSKEKIKKQKKQSKKQKAKVKEARKKELALLKKGKDIRPKKKLLVHDLAKSEALVWLAKSYTSNQQYTEADAILTHIKSDNTFLRNYDKDVLLAYAFNALEQKNYNAAVPYIQQAIEQTKKQKNKARLQFILAQIFEQNGNTKDAKKLYQQSTKKNNNFEMIFYGKLRQIQMSGEDNKPDKETERLLSKMLKDSKNKPYFDQLYYQKALFALADKNRDDAKKYLQKSIDVSQDNTKQKAISYTKLADLNYEEELYANAQALYDSALALIDENFADYTKVNTRSQVLTELITHLETISVNDSLLVLANMPSKQLETMLYEKATQQIDQEIKNEQKQKQADLVSAAKQQSGKNDKGAWYFYNESARTSGYKKFKQKWGDIELADNWRRSEKSSDNNVSASNNKDEDDYLTKIDKRYNEMLDAIPKTEEEKGNLSNEIVDAYYNAAIVYKSGLDNIPKSIQMFEALNSKYPKNKYEDEALYQLYVMYKNIPNIPKADKAKNELLAQYPKSKFTEYIKDPNALTKKDGQEVNDYYESLYQKYKQEKYDEVIAACNTVNTKYTVNPIAAKFDLLKAMAIGGKKEKEPFIASLEYVVANHKNTEEEAKATEILAYLRGEEPNAVPNGLNNNNINPNAPKTLDKGKINTGKEDLQNPEKIDAKDGLKINLGNKELEVGGKKDKAKKGE
ncbi:MAG: hypothetical protein LRY27_02450 [Chitinophagales bacterium]|nr:hypothetical protein [Chitinophagales bacterium]